MDNSNDLSQSILQSSEIAFPSTETTGILDSIKSINFTTWLLIIIILAFLGFNIFVYLAKGTQDITNIFSPILQKIFGVTTAVTGQTVNISAEGAKKVIGGTANAIEQGLTAVQEITPNTSKTSIKSQPINQQQIDMTQNTSLDRAISTAQQQNTEYQSDYASSSIQGGGKAGWCYIGDDRGYRSCAAVGVNDVCMSGEIFPSQEICVNPTLRT